MTSLKATCEKENGSLISAQGIEFDRNRKRPLSESARYVVKGFNVFDLVEKKQAFILASDINGNDCQLACRLEESEVYTVYFYDLSAIDQEIEDASHRYDRLDAISRSTGLGTWEWNVQTGETRFNERWAEIIGYTLEELQPVSIETWMSFGHPDDLGVSGQLLDAYWSGKTDQYVCEARMKHKNGHWIWVVDIGKTITYTKEGQPEWMVGSHQEITDRKRNELLLTRYRKRLEQTNKVARIGSWEVNLETNLIEWSDLTREIHEVEKEAFIKVEDGIQYYKPGYSRNRIQEVFNRALTNGEPYDEELQIVTAKGNERWVRAIGIPRMTNGKCEAVYGVFQDIDKQKKALQKLHESREQFRSTFDNAPNGNALIDLQGYIIEANEKLAMLTGRKRNELIGAKVTDFIENDISDRLSQVLKDFATRQTEDYSNVLNVLDYRGRIKTCMVGISAVGANESALEQCVMQFNDISELREAQSELENQLVRLNSSEQVIIIEADENSKVVFFNIGAQKALGYEPGAAMQRLTLSNLVAEDTWEAFCKETNQDCQNVDAAEVLRGLTVNAPMEPRECIFVNSKREEVYTLLGVNRYIKSGQHERFFLVATNISKQKRAEQELNEILDITRSQNDRLLSFAQIVSHNLRSHTSNLLMLLNLIQKQEPDLFESEYLHMVDKAAKGLHVTIQDLSKIAAVNNTSTLPSNKVPLRKLVDKLQEQFLGAIRELDGTVNISIEKTVVVSGSHTFVESIFTNLFSNAIKYASRERPLKININGEIVNEEVHVKFTDNGRGFDSESQKNKVFKLYQTFHKVEDSRGIGLFITKNQIEQMGGSINVESKPGQGATFYLTFKRAT